MIKVDNISIQPKTSIKFLSDKSTESNVTHPQKSDKIELSQKKSREKNSWKYFLGTLAAAGAGVGIYFLCRKKPPKIDIKPPSIEPPVERPVVKPNWQIYNELKAEEDKYYQEFMALDRNSDRSAAQKKMADAANALSDFKEKAKIENFSLLEKKDLSSAGEEEILDYFLKYAFPLMKNNEATALDGVEMFDRFGLRKYIKLHKNDMIKDTSLEEFIASAPKEPSDNFISKFFDVIEKYALPNNVNDDSDISMLRYVLLNSDYNLVKNMSEDSLLKAFNIMKKMEFQNTKLLSLPDDIKISYLNYTFKNSPRLHELEAAINELKVLSNNPKGIE